MQPMLSLPNEVSAIGTMFAANSNPPPSPTRRLLRTKEAAQYLCMSPWSLRQMVEHRELPYVSVGDHTSAWRFDIRDLDRWIEDHKLGK